jgi:hypothetical protein
MGLLAAYLENKVNVSASKASIGTPISMVGGQ